MEISMKVCSAAGCEYRAAVEGQCIGHDGEMRRPKGPFRHHRPGNTVDGKMCDFEDCERPHKALGLCNGHYKQSYDGAELTPLRHKQPKVLGSWFPYKP